MTHYFDATVLLVLVATVLFALWRISR